jgi:hypothetical protein
MEAERFEKLMAAENDLYEKTVAVVAAPHGSKQLEEAYKQLAEAEARKENLINSFPANLRREVRELEAEAT